jgi:hypothetical protein
LKELQAQETHCRQLTLALALGLLGGQGFEQIRKLHPPAHDFIRGFVPKLLPHVGAVIGVEESPDGIAGAQDPAGERVD